MALGWCQRQATGVQAVPTGVAVRGSGVNLRAVVGGGMIASASVGRAVC